jgi:plastocyanin
VTARRSVSTPVTCLAAALAAVPLALTGACGRPALRSHTVEIRGFAYLPATLQVAVGDTVIWINRDVVPHTATRDGRGWDSGSINAEQAWRLIATSAGSQPYYCAFHPVMRGELVVR